MSKNFDVFLAHSSKDKPLIRQLYRQLQERGIQPWLDEEEIPPGTQFQDEIQQAIGQIKTAAICIGQGGLGRWQALEIKTFISQCVERDIPVIPVLLPEVKEIPENLLFLQNFHAVFFRVGIDDEQALFQLEWGITGNKPKRPVVTNKAGSQAVNPGRKEIPNPLVDLGNGITLEMVTIPGGSFLMGSVPGEKGSRDNERPQHRVTVQSFSMGKYPVTQAEWRAIARRGDLKINQDLDPNPAYFKDKPDSDRRPVEQVSWDDAIEFCGRLFKLTKHEYRLPSEAEWEYACRAGTTTAYSFGDNINEKLANYNQNTGETTPVGKYPPNKFGIYDMHGNVWEWCADYWHGNYENAPTDGRAWLAENGGNSSNRLLRGGSWYNTPLVCRSAYRINGSRDSRGDYIGFRVCCVPPRASS